MKYLSATFALVIIAATLGCREKTPPLTDAEIAEITKDGASVIVERDEGLTLEGLEGVYLGQSMGDAVEWMEKHCKRFVSLEGGIRREGSRFRGCDTPDHEFLYSFRVGFTERADNRVFTLELKRRNLEPKLVRARFHQHVSKMNREVVRPAIIRVEGARYNMYADWDEGADGPTHILIGLTDEGVNALMTTE